MTDLEKAARMALEALEQLQGGCIDSNDGTMEAITVWCPEVIAALRQALANEALDKMAKNARELGLDYGPAQQESVGYVYSVHGERIKNACIESDVPNGTPLYTSPQSKPWVGLTWDELPDSSCDDPAFLAGAQWANSKLKEKNA